MHELQNARREVTTTARDVAYLMTAIHMLLSVCEDRVNAFWSQAGTSPDGALRGMAGQIERLFTVVSELGQVAVATAAPVHATITAILTRPPPPGGDSPQWAELRAECTQALQVLSTLRFTVLQVEQKAVLRLETLHEAALRRDVSPEVSATFDALLQRMRHPRTRR